MTVDDENIAKSNHGNIANSNNEIMLEDGEEPGDFTDLNNEISTHDDEMKLEKNYFYNTNRDRPYIDGIVIEKDNFIIDGQGHTIDGRYEGRIFEIRSNNVTLKNINFINGLTFFKGAAAAFNNDGTVINCTFTNNHGMYSNGGALYFNENGTIINSTFTRNTADSDGGAIYAHNLLIENSTFQNNKGRTGGAAYAYNNANIINSTFAGNNVSQFGGAIFCKNGTFAIENSTFTGNDANIGGALYTVETNSTLINCQFANNNAEDAKGGGAIYIADEIEASIENSNFTNNTSSLKGGAISIESDSTNEDKKIILKDLIFSENIAGSDGGAIFTSHGNRTIKNCTFRDNNGKRGGAIYASSGTVNIENSTIESNSASLNGGAIYASIERLNIKSSELTNNNADEHGGAIYTKKNATIENSAFNGNNAKSGGAIYSNGELTINGSSFENNKANDGSDNIGLDENGSAITNNTSPEDLNPLKSIDMEIISVSNITYGDTVRITVKISKNGELISEGSVFTLINSENYSSALSEGIGTIEIPNLNAKTYDVCVNYIGNEEYAKPSQNISFTVDKQNASIQIIELNNISYGDILKIKVNVRSDLLINEGNISISINDKKYVADIENGIGTIEIPNLKTGNYTGDLVFTGENFNNSSENISFKVDKEDMSIKTIYISNATFGDSVVIIAEAISNDNKIVNEGEISIAIKNKTYSAKVDNGIATITIPNLNAGTYSSNLRYIGENYNEALTNITFKVLKQNSAISASNKAFVINYGGKYSITLKDAKGKVMSCQKISFALNGKSIGTLTTNAKGIATVSLTAKILKAAKAGKKNLVIKFTHTNYNSLSKTVKITNNKEKTVLTAKKASFKKSKKIKKYSVILKNSKGKAMKKQKIYLKVKGKTYAAKTNAKGKAIFNIKNLSRKGSFTASIQYKGNAYYKAANKKVKIIVK